MRNVSVRVRSVAVVVGCNGDIHTLNQIFFVADIVRVRIRIMCLSVY